MEDLSLIGEKRRLDEIEDDVESVDKKIKFPEVKVYFELFTDHPDFIEESDREFIDSEDNTEIYFESLGYIINHDACRNGKADVYVDEEYVGLISYALIDRNWILTQWGSMWEACNADEIGLEIITKDCFNNDGSVSNLLEKFCVNSETASTNFFLFIKSIQLNEPFDIYAEDAYFDVRVKTIDLFINSPLLYNQGHDATVNLIIYIPNGFEENGEFSNFTQKTDERAFLEAGFQGVKNRNSDFLFFEPFPYKS